VKPATLSYLDEQGTAAALLDGRGRILHINSSMEAFLDRGGPLFVRERQLRAHDTRACHALERLISSHLVGGTAERAMPVAFSHSTRELPIIVRVHPISEPSIFDLVHARLLVIINDPMRSRPRDTGLLQQAFGLTVKEAAIAAQLTNGSELQDIAVQHDVSLNTVKVHLHRILRKTQTSSRAQLVSRLLRTLDP
jgi:DNA-binding CsgD family transcriptional regulator